MRKYITIALYFITKQWLFFGQMILIFAFSSTGQYKELAVYSQKDTLSTAFYFMFMGLYLCSFFLSLKIVLNKLNIILPNKISLESNEIDIPEWFLKFWIYFLMFAVILIIVHNENQIKYTTQIVDKNYFDVIFIIIGFFYGVLWRAFILPYLRELSLPLFKPFVFFRFNEWKLIFLLILFLVYVLASFFFLTSNSLNATGLPTLFLLLSVLNILFVEFLLNGVKYYEVLFVFLIILVFSYFNDNSQIRTFPTNTERLSNDEYFDLWLQKNVTKDSQIVPCIFVAAEGGGIRGTAWTWFVLNTLKNEYPNFEKYNYAISGVSGGGVGAVLYATTKDLQINEVQIKNILSHDFLSKTIAAYMFHVPVQAVIPFPIGSLDRNRIFEDELSYIVNENLNSKVMNEGFLSNHVENLKLFNSKSPILLLNTTLAETGQKAIVSSVDLGGYELSYPKKPFSDIVDIFNYIDSNNDMPIKTAASLTARFPFVASGALIKNEKLGNSGHLTDGGYIDNTGIETCFQMIKQMKESIEVAEKKYKIKIKPYIIFIKNSFTYYDPTKSKSAYKFLHETNSIIGSVYNSWDNSSNSAISIFEHAFKSDSISLITLQLTRPHQLQNKEEVFPLGWQISKDKLDEISTIAKTQVVHSRDYNGRLLKTQLMFDLQKAK